MYRHVVIVEGVRMLFGRIGKGLRPDTSAELARRGARYGMFSSCCGGGLGVSTLIENLEV